MTRVERKQNEESRDDTPSPVPMNRDAFTPDVMDLRHPRLSLDWGARTIVFLGLFERLACPIPDLSNGCFHRLHVARIFGCTLELSRLRVS